MPPKTYIRLHCPKCGNRTGGELEGFTAAPQKGPEANTVPEHHLETIYTDKTDTTLCPDCQSRTGEEHLQDSCLNRSGMQGCCNEGCPCRRQEQCVPGLQSNGSQNMGKHCPCSGGCRSRMLGENFNNPYGVHQPFHDTQSCFERRGESLQEVIPPFEEPHGPLDTEHKNTPISGSSRSRIRIGEPRRQSVSARRRSQGAQKQPWQLSLVKWFMT
jgi:hypothetical protein